MCKVLSVSETGYYKWLRNGPTKYKWQIIMPFIYAILNEHPDNANYGVARMKIALEQHGVHVSASTVRKAMNSANLLKPSHRSPNGLTKADKKAPRPKDLLKMDFRATEPGKKFLTDITVIPCKNGKLYVSPILDCYSGEIVSLTMDTNMKKELCIKTVEDMYKRIHPKDGWLLHSDAGSQYTSWAFRKTLGKLRAVQSMSDAGSAYGNCRMESFFATLKKEKIYQIDTEKLTVKQVKRIVWRYVMGYYNRFRITTTNAAGLPPSICREKWEMKRNAA